MSFQPLCLTANDDINLITLDGLLHKINDILIPPRELLVWISIGTYFRGKFLRVCFRETNNFSKEGVTP